MVKELTYEQENLITEANKEKKIQKEIEEEEKLKECYDWWKNLSEDLQYRIMLDWFPFGIKEDTDVDKFFGDLPDDKQLWIYKREKGEVK